VFQNNEEDLLINEIGNYQGNRPIAGPDPVVFDIDADGAWSIHIEGLETTTSAAFSGSGDQVSDIFQPSNVGPWEFSHDGERNFAVWLHCEGGDDLVQNEIGVVTGSGVVNFEDGPCFWEVEADGNWSLAPR
jgi:hypothetical protein